MMKQIDVPDATVVVAGKHPEDYTHEDESEPMIQLVQESLTPKMDGAKPKYQDLPFAVGFLMNCLVIVGLFLSNPIALGQLDHSPAATRPQEEKQPKLDFPLSSGSIVSIVLISLGVASVWLKTLLKYTNSMIRMSLMLNIGIFLFMGCTSLFVNPILGLFCLLGAFFAYRYMRTVENRIAFATANLKIACAALSQYESIFFLAYALILVQMVWFLLWSAALGSVGMMFQLNISQQESCKERTSPNGSVYRTCNQSTKAGGGFWIVFFFLLLSVYWGQQVLHNVSTCTIAGTVASWWYQHDSAISTSVVSKSLGRSLTTSFGSICFGSLIVALVQALRTMADMKLRQARSNRNDDNNSTAAATDMIMLAIACLASCILQMLERFLEYFNAWAYTYIGIYGMDFRTSGKSVIELFKARGWTAIVNDDLTASALSLGAFVMGLFCGVLGLLIAAIFGDGQKYGAVAYSSLGLIGFVTGICMTLILSNVVTAALRTVFVCFAEDPNALSKCHPEHHKELVGAWREFQGDVFMASFQNQPV